MLPAPRVIVIDDESKHLDGLTQGLNQYGVACLPLHFTGETDTIPSCPYVRVIFADLHLSGGTPGDYARDFSIIGGLIESTIKPSGPYLIIMWTKYPEQADGLRDFLKDRLQDVRKPFAVQALDKSAYLDPQGSVKNAEALVEAIRKIVEGQPQVGALFNWEERVLGAAGDAISSIMDLAESAVADGTLSEEVGRLLSILAVEAVGKQHADEDWFRAVNEALLPILDDRIATMRSRDVDNDLWQTAMGEANTGRKLSLDEAAKLNRLLHIAPSTHDGNGAERGAVIDLPEELSETFADTFDLAPHPQDAAEKQFWSKRLGKDDDSFRWVLVQTQAACDYAQTQPGPLPFHLGLCLLASRVRRGTAPAALWRSPCFEFDGQACHLHVNARFQVSLPSAKAEQAGLMFRLREQLLNDLIYQLHGYGARPGIISFRSK